jgi:hypothetical protein
MSHAEIVPAAAVEREAAIEELRGRIAALVAERQHLRSFGAGQSWLEQNRLELGHSQRELAHALIQQHRPAFS